MRKFISTLLLALLSATVVAGCEGQSMPSETSDPAPAPKVLSTFSFGTPPGLDSTAWEQATAEEKQARLAATSRATIAFEEAAENASSWTVAHRRVQTLLRNPPSDAPRYQLEQIAANQMLGKWLLKGKATPEKQEAIARYTTFLLENNNPEAKLVSKSLKSLEGYWQRERIATAAGQAAQAAQAKLAEKANCESCGLEKLSKKFPFLEEGQRKRQAQAFDAIGNLKKLEHGEQVK